MNKDRRKLIEGACESASEGKDLLNEQIEPIKELVADLRGGESSGIRTRMQNILSVIETAHGKIDDAASNIETAKDEEEEYKDNMPENMQSGDKYSNAEQAVSDLDEAYSYLGTARDEADSMMTSLTEMIGEDDRNEWTEEDANTLEDFEDKINEIDTNVESANSSAESATSY